MVLISALVLAALLLCLWLLVARPAVYFAGAQSQRGPNIVDPAMLEKHVRVLSEQMIPRSHAHPQMLSRVAAYIASRLESYGATVSEQVYHVAGHTYKNVIAEFGPADGPLLVVGAHYDAVGSTPGADDNASGIAGLLETGRLLASSDPDRRVVLVAFTLEEMPYFGGRKMGSAVFAQSLVDAGDEVSLMINYEMIGYFTEQPRSQSYPSLLLHLIYPSRGDFIAVVDQVFSRQAAHLKRWMSRATEVPVYSINAPAWLPGVDFSDHRNFWAHDYPAVMVTDTAFYRNRAYHTAEDTADRLDYQRMAQVVYGVYSYIMNHSGPDKAAVAATIND